MIHLLAALNRRWRRTVLRALLFLFAASYGCVACPCAHAADDLDLRLHFAWGSGETRRWQGRVVFSFGTLSDLQLLGMDTDQPGSIQLLGQQVLISQKRAHTYGGFEVSVRAPHDESLRIELLAAGDHEARVIQVPLSELIEGSRTETLDDRGNRLVIRRAPSDRIRVTTRRDHMVFATGESIQLFVQGYRLGVEPDTSLRCRMALNSAQSRTPIWEDERRHLADADGSWAEPDEIAMELPEEEGVYSFEFVISSPRRPPFFASEKILARRRIQLVVLADASPDNPDAGERRLVLGIDPTQANWFRRIARLPQWSLLPGFRADGPLGNIKTQRVDRGGRTWSRLATGGWQAYPLPVDAVGALHELELEFAGDVEQSFSVSLVEPDAAGKVIPIGLDSGVVVSSSGDTPIDVPAPEVSRHRLLFWPKTKTPLLLITNLSDKHESIYGRFNVYRRSLSTVAPVPGQHRMAVAFFERPLFPEAFGASEMLDDESGRSLEDWQTFLDGARRMIQYAKYVGYDALAITCASEGSTLYPSRLLQPTPRHDRGLFFGSAQDPFRKDVMELLFRLCNRENLKLIPVVEFASPLPALEAQLLQPDQAEGIVLVDASQATWLQRFDSQRGRAAYYNPLDERVQQAMLDVIDELATRYGRHPSFAGITVNLHSDGYTQLPDIDWGMDARTWDQFRRDRQVQMARPDTLNSATQEKWLDWRAERIGQLYVRMAKRLAGYRPESRLYLAGSRLIAARPIQRAFRPSLPRQIDFEQAMLEIGFSSQYMEDQPNLVLLRPRLFAPPHTSTGGPATTEFNGSPEVEQFFRQTKQSGAQFLHLPHLMRLPSFDEASPFGKSNTLMSLVAQVSPVGLNNRQRFAHSLAVEDSPVIFEGGWMLPVGQEEPLREFLNVYRQLPRASFDNSNADRRKWQPLRIRSHSTSDATYLYVVNDSPWYVGAAISLEGADGAQFTSLDQRPQQAVAQERGEAVWNLTMAPYDLVAIRADRPGIRVSDAAINLPPDVKPALENRIRSLGLRVARLGDPAPLTAPKNAGFEGWDPALRQPLEWSVRGQPDVVSLDTDNVHDGSSALRIQLPNGSVSLRSSSIDPPDSQRLSVSIWARVTDPKQQPRVRLVLEVDGRIYHPWSPIGVGGPDRAMGQQWKEFVFRVSQLPPVDSSLKIGIEIAGTGEVLLDDIRLYDILVLDTGEHKALNQLLAGADYQRRMGMVSDCLRILGGYWPKYLIENVPEAALDIADRPPTEPIDSPAESPAREASTWERIRRHLPMR